MSKHNNGTLKEFYSPKYIMSIHGWNSNREWQFRLSNSITALGYIPISYTYGRKILRIFRWHIDSDVSKFKDWYFTRVNDKNYDININKPYYRPSIIAHSLGSWILAKALVKYPEIKFDKIFLVGAIISPDFDWFTLILNDQVNSVVYERSDKDKVVLWSRLLTGSKKTCTRDGFLQKSSLISEEKVPLFNHGDFGYEQHFIAIIGKYMSAIPHQLNAIQGSKLKKSEIRKYFKSTLKIDNEIFNDAIYQASPVSITMGLEWFNVEPDIWTFIKNTYTNSILGYINAIPVNDSTYNEFISGRLEESKITPNHIISYSNSEKYNLLILSIAIKKTFRGGEIQFRSKITEFLMMAFVNSHLHKDSKLQKIAAIGWSREGCNLCEGFGMIQTNYDFNNHPIYELDTKNLSNLRHRTNVNFMAKWFYKNYEF